MTPRPGPAALITAIATSAVVGLLVAALALPFIGAAAIAAKKQADGFLTLPTDFDAPVLPERSAMLAADGSLIARFYVQNRIPTPLDQVPLHTQQALLAIEDARFYEHNGVDVAGVARAAVENVTSGRIEEGASTLTQQYVKNALIQSADTEEEVRAARETSFERKLREARLALALENRLSKDEILERYLNIAYFGNGVYGIGAAAQFYFSKHVTQLTIAESALLVGLVQRPEATDPLTKLDSAIARRDVVLRRMAEVGFLDNAQLVAALQKVPNIRVSSLGSGCGAVGVQAPFFCDYVWRYLQSDALGDVLGTTPVERQQRLLEGGLTIRTTLDPRMQAPAERAVGTHVPPTDPSGVAAAYVAVEPGTGDVKTMAVNRTFSEKDLPGHTKVNLAIGGSSGMQAGSAFKPFVLAAAIEKGIPLNLTLYAPNRYESRVFKNCDGQTCDNPYVVHNAGDSSAGVYDIVGATHHSVNTFYIQLEERTGVERPAQIAEAFGLHQFQNGEPTAPLHRGGSFVLGVNEVSPLSMAAAYATWAAHGVYCPPRPVVSIHDNATGKPLELPPQQCRQAVSPQVADTVTSVLRGTIDGPSPYRTAARAQIGRPAAGKTGTTNGSRAAWFVGFTPQLAAAAWVGKPDPEPMRFIRVNGRYYRQIYGGTLAAPIWRDAMSVAMEGQPVVDMPPMAVSRPYSSRRSSDDDDSRENRRASRSAETRTERSEPTQESPERDRGRGPDGAGPPGQRGRG